MLKRLGRLIIIPLLALFTRGIIRKYHPKIIMVTGSVGKTSTKNAVALALADSYFLRASEKSFNSELGVPFTIIGAHNPWRRPLAWLHVFKQALALLVFLNHYPKLLVLEVGADRAGDMTRILRIATPDAVIVTRLPEVPVHVEAYATPQAVREEEFFPAYALPPGAPLIISADDARALAMAARVPAHLITYGFQENAHVRLMNVRFLLEKERPIGMQADILYKEEKGIVTVRGGVGRQQLLPLAAAVASAAAFDIPLKDALTALEDYTPAPGRSRIFEGIRNSLIIDDSYNASPAAVEEALETIRALPHVTRRIAVLGDMLELGRYSIEEHMHTGKKAAEIADVIIAIGIRARGIASAARDAGLPEEAVHIFNTAYEAIPLLSSLVKENDALLIKGSQNVRMERITEALLAHEEDSADLPRQDPEWKKIP